MKKNRLIAGCLWELGGLGSEPSTLSSSFLPAQARLLVGSLLEVWLPIGAARDVQKMRNLKPRERCHFPLQTTTGLIANEMSSYPSATCIPAPAK